MQRLNFVFRLGCSVDGLVNTQLPANCTRLGGSCDDFECAYGYKKNESIASLNCSETGLWNIELSTLCVG